MEQFSRIQSLHPKRKPHKTQIIFFKMIAMPRQSNGLLINFFNVVISREYCPFFLYPSQVCYLLVACYRNANQIICSPIHLVQLRISPQLVYSVKLRRRIVHYIVFKYWWSENVSVRFVETPKKCGERTKLSRTSICPIISPRTCQISFLYLRSVYGNVCAVHNCT